MSSIKPGHSRGRWALVVLAVIAAFAMAVSGAPGREIVSAQQSPCIGIFPPPPGCDSVPGRISVNAGGPYSGTVGQAVIFRATVSSPLPPGTSFQFQWNFGDGTSGFGQTASHVYTVPGTFTVTVSVFGGGQSAFATTSASIVRQVQPLQVSANGPYAGQVNVPIQFTSSVTGAPLGTGISYQWAFGDGTFGSGANPTKTYAAPGTYTVSLQVRTTAGQTGFASAIATVTRQTLPLSVSANGPYTGTLGSTITFVGSTNGASNPRFQWNFGDGSAGTGQSVSHSYRNAGTFTVSLTVTDLTTGQIAQASTTATISPPPTPAPPPPPPAPFARSFAAMAYHPPSGQVVLFGGLICQGNQCTDQNDTWTWDGTTWTQQSPSNSPDSRYGATMAYHEPSQRLVLFGGIDCTGPDCVDKGDTWTWDGTNWTRAEPSASPRERSDAAMTFDADRGVIVLFGGQDTGGDVLGDTWTWNGSTWTEQNPSTAPDARFGSGLAFDTARGVAVLFGGSNNTGSNFADTWTWNGENWTEANPASSPTPRGLVGMDYDTSRNVVVLFGGVHNGNQPLGDTWTWNGTTWTQQSPTNSPSPRYGPAVAFNGGTNTIVLFSGTNGNNDTWIWNGNSWVSQ